MIVFHHASVSGGANHSLWYVRCKFFSGSSTTSNPPSGDAIVWSRPPDDSRPEQLAKLWSPPQGTISHPL